MKQCLYLKLQYAKSILVESIIVYYLIYKMFFSVKLFALGNNKKILKKKKKKENKQPKKEKDN